MSSQGFQAPFREPIDPLPIPPKPWGRRIRNWFSDQPEWWTLVAVAVGTIGFVAAAAALGIYLDGVHDKSAACFFDQAHLLSVDADGCATSQIGCRSVYYTRCPSGSVTNTSGEKR